MSTGSLKGQVAVVTGAAQRLGRTIALGLAAEGARVVVHYRGSEAEAREVAAEITQKGGESLCIHADLSYVDQIDTLFTAVEKHFGRLDILVNNAGLFHPTPLADTTEAQWDALFDSNVKAQFFCAQRAAPLLRSGVSTRGGKVGHIVNFASLGGLLAWPKYTAYSVSKAGVIMLTRCLARSLAPAITVNAIAPGTISFPDDDPALAEAYIQKAPLARTGTPQDILDAVLYLVKAEFITGQVMVVDGGRSIPT